MVFGPDTHTDDFLQAHTGRFWRHNLRARGDICKRSGIRVLFEPPFFKALRKGRLFYCGVGWIFDGARLGFSFIQVLEWYLGVKERPVSVPCSLTGKFGGSE